MSRRSIKNLRSTRSLESSSSLAPRKVSSYSWEIEGSDYIRKITFKVLKDGEKLGFGLGGQGKRTEVVCVRVGTQSYWKGLKEGYKVISVNGNQVNDITVKASICDATSSGKDFTIGFQVPGKPDWPDSQKDGVSSTVGDTGPPADDKPEEKKENTAVEEEKKVSIITEEPIIDKGIIEDSRWENFDDGLFGAFDDIEDEYDAIMNAGVKMNNAEAEDLSEERLGKLSKAELEELKRLKEEQYNKLKEHELRLKELIKRKEKEFREEATRDKLENLKELRRRRKQIADRAKRLLDELDRIRRMLARRLSDLADGIKDLAAISAARDARLREMEATIKLMESRARVI